MRLPPPKPARRPPVTRPDVKGPRSRSGDKAAFLRPAPSKPRARHRVINEERILAYCRSRLEKAKLPTIKELADRHGCSTTDIRRILAADGIDVALFCARSAPRAMAKKRQ